MRLVRQRWYTSKMYRTKHYLVLCAVRRFTCFINVWYLFDGFCFNWQEGGEAELTIDGERTDTKGEIIA